MLKLILAALLAALLCGCGGGADDEPEGPHGITDSCVGPLPKGWLRPAPC